MPEEGHARAYRGMGLWELPTVRSDEKEHEHAIVIYAFMIPRRFATPQYRYILSMEIIDHTGSTYVSMFNDDAEALLGIKAGELNELLNSNKEASEEVFKRPLFKEYIFTLRVKVRKRGEDKGWKDNE